MGSGLVAWFVIAETDRGNPGTMEPLGGIALEEADFTARKPISGRIWKRRLTAPDYRNRLRLSRLIVCRPGSPSSLREFARLALLRDSGLESHKAALPRLLENHEPAGGCVQSFYRLSKLQARGLGNTFCIPLAIAQRE
jgi:hypothetical protein